MVGGSTPSKGASVVVTVGTITLRVGTKVLSVMVSIYWEFDSPRLDQVRVMELVDMRVSKTRGVKPREGSSPSFDT